MLIRFHQGTSKDFPHLLFHGPSGAGKKTRVLTLLREIYGPSVLKVRPETRTIKKEGGKSVEVTVMSSKYHIELNPSDAGMQDRMVRTFSRYTLVNTTLGRSRDHQRNCSNKASGL